MIVSNEWTLKWAVWSQDIYNFVFNISIKVLDNFIFGHRIKNALSEQ